jgi:hypothetical protein
LYHFLKKRKEMERKNHVGKERAPWPKRHKKSLFSSTSQRNHVSRKEVDGHAKMKKIFHPFFLIV